MKSLAYINLATLEDTLISLLAAFVLGGLIGLERQIRQRTAGLRTNVLVCVGAALFVDIAMRFFELHGGPASPLHVVAYVVSGVGFLGAGVIMREGGSVRGINTAATLWASAAVGCAAGLDLLLEAVMGAVFVIAANTLLRPVVNLIHSQPMDTAVIEASFRLFVTAEAGRRQDTLALLERLFSPAGMPLHDVETRSEANGVVQIEAMLLPNSVESVELDALVVQLCRAPFVKEAYWTASTED